MVEHRVYCNYDYWRFTIYIGVSEFIVHAGKIRGIVFLESKRLNQRLDKQRL